MKIRKQFNHTIFFFALIFVTTLIFSSCSGDDVTDITEEEVIDDLEVETEVEEIIETYADSDFAATDWTTASHSKEADPDFDEIFEDNTVKRLDIVITEERWERMLDDMTATYGTFGSNAGPGGGLIETDENPIFVPASVLYSGREWYRVGVRFKGNSSLQGSWRAGILKLSFKLDFDEFEDEYPQIDNQRFYGFKKLSLKNNFNDRSMLREKVATDVFRNAGLVASHTAFYTVYVDYGDGPQYFGVYTMVEEVDDTVLDEQFSDDDGNLYKPDGDAASFAAGTFNQEEYEKKTNEDEADFSDVQNLLDILHNNTRTTDPAVWCTQLDVVLDTDVFLKYLAVNTVIQNWDTYGRMTHNYFLYNNPDIEKLTWIPWDNNEALQEGNREGAVALDFSGVTASEWPLIGYLYQDEVYKAVYDNYVQEVVDGPFNANTMQTLYSSYASLVAPYASMEEPGYSFLNNNSDFQMAISELNTHVLQRTSAVNSYLHN